MITLLISVLSGVIFILFAVLFSMLTKRKVQKMEKQNENETITVDDIENNLFDRKKALSDIIVPDGVSPDPYSYMTIDDAGHTVYIRCFTINTLPKTTKFATTFRPIFSFPHVHSSVFIMPEVRDKTKKKLDKHITMLDGEQIGAIKKRDRNRYRSLQGQLNDAETWVSKIEEGYDKFYKVQFLFVLEEDSLQKLNTASDSFYATCKNSSIDINATYACHPEAFLSGAPYGQPYGQPIVQTKGKKVQIALENKAPLKVHYMSRGAVADVFNHIKSDFRHKNGVPLGRTFDNRPVFFDPFDQTHQNGYGMIIAGTTGCGKTTLVKLLAKRLHNTHNNGSGGGYRFVSIDSQRRGNRGEYSSLADDLNGVCHQIKHNSSFIINFCEVSDQLEYDELTKTEYRALHLAERESVIVTNLLMLVQGTKKDMDFVMGVQMESILSDIVSECFDDLGIFDGDVESLYTLSDGVDESGNIVKKRVKKKLPTISMIYKKTMKYSKKADEDHKRTFGVLLDSLKKNVHFIAYVDLGDRYQFLDRESYEDAVQKKKKNVTIDGQQYPVQYIQGKMDYFDGQSTFEFSRDCACTNLDISGLPENERPMARQVCMSFVTEEFSKNNSMNFSQKDSDKLVIILDECNDNYKYQFMRKSIDEAYRQNRKRNVSTWILQQALSDGSQYDDLKGVWDNTAVMLLFKQPENDREFLKKRTKLNETQISDVITIGIPPQLPDDPDEAMEEMNRHIGECCLIDGAKTVFFKVDVLKESELELIASNKQTLNEIYQKQRLANQNKQGAAQAGA